MKILTPVLLAAVLFTAGCASDPRFGYNTEYLGEASVAGMTRKAPAYDNVSYWDGDGAPGSPAIKIKLGEQRAYFYKGGQLVGVSVISTGREGFDTTTGTFKIIQKDRDHKSNLYGDYVDRNGTVLKSNIDVKTDKRPPGAIFDGAKMPYFMRVVGGTGMHEGFLPGYPASHGCIRMPEFMAKNFFSAVNVGTPVSIAR